MSFSLRKYLYVAGVKARNNLILPRFKFLLASQKWSREQLHHWQLERLKELLEHAQTQCGYYQKKFAESGVNVSDIVELADLSKIPVLTKEDLLKNVGGIQVRPYPEKLFYSETSGSTGKPLVFYRNKDWDAWHRASVYRGYSWYGVNPWDRNGYLWGFNFSLSKRAKTRFLDYLQNRFRLFSYRDDEIDIFLRKLKKATFLSGYSSMIYEVAKRIDSFPTGPDFHLKLVKGTSEKILDSYHRESLRAFGKRVTSEYGAAEAGIIAFECPEGNMHINLETVIVEEVDHEIVVTNLVSKSFPIIRYRLGDLIEIDDQSSCGCGMAHPIIRDVLGRVGKVIHGIKDTYPSLTLYYVFKNLAMSNNLILNYQATQKSKGELDVSIDSILGPEERTLLNNEFAKYFKSDIKIVVREGADLKSLGKKKADFVSEI